ncbi:peroxidase family protein, partial [Vibrio parahaemolyticus V-223/04]
VRGSN